MQNGDKLWHFVTGALLLGLLVWVGLPERVALVILFAVAMAKEAWDSVRPNHTCDAQDMIASVMGGVFMLELFK